MALRFGAICGGDDVKASGLVRKEYVLECIAPLHIGSGENLMAFEYLYDRKRQEVYFLDESKWIAFLEKRRLMDEFAAYVERQAFQKKSLWEWLLALGVREEELRALASRKAYAETLTVQRDRRNTLNDIACQIALADGAPYIPGSAIKGALRTGILHGIIKKEPQRFQRFWQDIQSTSHASLRAREKEWGRIVLRLEQAALHTLSLPNTRTGDAVVSALRGIRVSDAVCAAGEKDTIVLQKVDLTTKKRQGEAGENKISLFRECLPAGRKLRFSITADLSMLQTLGLSSLEEAIDRMRTYAKEGLHLQERTFDKDYRPLFEEAEAADCLLGGGTGFLSKTLVHALAPSEEEARRFIAGYLDERFMQKDKVTRRWVPSHDHKRLDTRLSPRTLKMARAGQDIWILGLCRMEEIG